MTSQNKIPVEHTDFFFDSDPRQLPSKFVVADHREQVKIHEEGRTDPYRDLPQSLGCHVSGWMVGHRRQNSPEAVFASVFLSDLKEVDIIREGLREITKIEGQEWAERMLASLDIFANDGKEK